MKLELTQTELETIRAALFSYIQEPNTTAQLSRYMARATKADTTIYHDPARVRQVQAARSEVTAPLFEKLAAAEFKEEVSPLADAVTCECSVCQAGRTAQVMDR